MASPDNVKTLMEGHYAIYKALSDLEEEKTKLASENKKIQLEKEKLARENREKDAAIRALEARVSKLETGFRQTWKNHNKVVKICGGKSPCRKCNGPGGDGLSIQT